MLCSFLKRFLILCSLAFTFCAWGELPDELKGIDQRASTKDTGRSGLPTLNHWLKILDTLVKRPQNKMNGSEESIKEKNEEYKETVVTQKKYRLPNQNLQNKS